VRIELADSEHQGTLSASRRDREVAAIGGVVEAEEKLFRETRKGARDDHLKGPRRLWPRIVCAGATGAGASTCPRAHPGLRFRS
jgi:hypothetical protein